MHSDHLQHFFRQEWHWNEATNPRLHFIFPSSHDITCAILQNPEQRDVKALQSNFSFHRCLNRKVMSPWLKWVCEWSTWAACYEERGLKMIEQEECCRFAYSKKKKLTQMYWAIFLKLIYCYTVLFFFFCNFLPTWEDSQFTSDMSLRCGKGYRGFLFKAWHAQNRLC